MKYFLTILAFFSALITLAAFIFSGWLFLWWLGGNFNIVLPGLGLVISGSLVLAVVLLFAVLMAALTVWLFRRINNPLR